MANPRHAPQAIRRLPWSRPKVAINDLSFLLRRDEGAEEHHPAALCRDRDRLHRPVGLRQVDPAAVPQPHVRALSRPARRRRGAAGWRKHPRPQARISICLRAKVGMVFQKPTPFPMTIYDNIAFGIKLYERLPKSRDRRSRRGCAAPRRAVGRGQGQAEASGSEPVGRPAAAPVHRARRSRSSPRCCCSTSRARRSIRSRPPRSRN